MTRISSQIPVPPQLKSNYQESFEEYKFKSQVVDNNSKKAKEFSPGQYIVFPEGEFLVIQVVKLAYRQIKIYYQVSKNHNMFYTIDEDTVFTYRKPTLVNKVCFKLFRPKISDTDSTCIKKAIEHSDFCRKEEARRSKIEYHPNYKGTVNIEDLKPGCIIILPGDRITREGLKYYTVTAVDVKPDYLNTWGHSVSIIYVEDTMPTNSCDNSRVLTLKRGEKIRIVGYHGRHDSYEGRFCQRW
jgi:hypothetical protein